MKSYAPSLNAARAVLTSVRGDHDRLGVRLQVARRAEHHEPRVGAVLADVVGAPALGHPQVGDDDVKRAVPELIERALDAPDDGRDVPGRAERIGHHLGVVLLVLDDQHLRAGGLLFGISWHRREFRR